MTNVAVFSLRQLSIADTWQYAYQEGLSSSPRRSSISFNSPPEKDGSQKLSRRNKPSSQVHGVNGLNRLAAYNDDEEVWKPLRRFSIAEDIGDSDEADRREVHSCGRARIMDAICHAGVMACVRDDREAVAEKAARAALDGGSPVLEVMCSTPNAAAILRRLRRDYPGVTLGAGTVMTREAARAVLDSGADFLVSPCTDQDLVREFGGGRALYIPGAMTPTEILTAHKLGARLVKLFPAGQAGGEALVRAMRRALPDVHLLAAQGMSMADVEPYLRAGAAAVVLSDGIFCREAMRAGDFEAIRRNAEAATLLGRRVVDSVICPVPMLEE